MPTSGSARNVLWVVTTQWRAQATSFSEDTNARTPCLAALAARGMSFRQAVTPHPFGPFARAALLTGVRSPENGVRDYYDPLPGGAETIAHAMNRVGVTTAFFGKWHLGARDRLAPLVGEAHARAIVPSHLRGGFTHWEGFESGFLLNDPWLHGTRISEPTRFPGYQSDVVCQRAGNWIAEQPERSCGWFCVVSVEPPHPPYLAPAAGVAPVPVESLQLRGNVPSSAAPRARRDLSGYYAHIEATDRAIGRLLASIDLETTLVVVTSVHGDMHGSHGLFRKGWPHEESIRVPLLIAGPGVRAGMDDRAFSLELLPRLSVAWMESGQVQLGLETFSRISMPSVVELPDQCDRIWRGLRSPARKIVLNEDGSPWLFFDLEDDPLEMRNLVGVAGWEGEIVEWRRKVEG